jgi:hypothetical protein
MKSDGSALPLYAPTEPTATARPDAELAPIMAAWLNGFAEKYCGFRLARSRRDGNAYAPWLVQTPVEENCDAMTNQKARNVKGFEISICCVLFPNIIKDVVNVRSQIAYPVGIFVGLIVAYWLPPHIRPPDTKISFVAWIGIALVASVGYWLLRSLVTFLWRV